MQSSSPKPINVSEEVALAELHAELAAVDAGVTGIMAGLALLRISTPEPNKPNGGKGPLMGQKKPKDADVWSSDDEAWMAECEALIRLEEAEEASAPVLSVSKASIPLDQQRG
jgi:hypothetical protein